MDAQTDTTDTPPPEPEAHDLASNEGADGAPRGRWLGRVVIGLVAVALLAGAVAVVQDDDEPTETSIQPLALSLGGDGRATAESAGAAADMALAVPYEYRLEGTLPDLGSDAPVYQLVQPALTADDVAAMAAAVGVSGTPTQMDGGWLVDSADGSLSVYPMPGAWSVSYSPYSMGVSTGGGSSEPDPGTNVAVEGEIQPGALPAPSDMDDAMAAAEAQALEDDKAAAEAAGVAVEDEPVEGVDPDTPVSSDGSTSDRSSRDADAAPATTVVDDTTLVEPMPVEPPIDPGITPPADLPSPAEAEQIARDVLDAMGVLDGADWAVTVTDSGMMGVAVACAEGEDCVDTPTEEYVMSRSVVFARVVDGVTVTGLEWSVEVGDAGAVSYVWGTLADLDPLGAYPLQSTAAVYDELVAGEGYGGLPVPMGGEPAVDMLAVDDGAVDDGVSDDEGTCTAADTDGDGVIDEESCEGSSGGGVDGSAGSAGGTEPAPAPDVCDDPAADCAVPMPEPVPMPPECDPAAADCDVEPMPEPEPVVVVVTGAELSAQVIWGVDAGVEVQYLVPSYRFVGHIAADGTDWSAELVALDESMVVTPEVPEPEPEPVPVTEEPPTTATTRPDVTVEPPVSEPTTSEPPTTEPPVTEAPATEPPTTEPTTTETTVPGPDDTIVCVTEPCNEPAPEPATNAEP